MSMCKNSKISEYVWFCDVTEIYNNCIELSKGKPEGKRYFLETFWFEEFRSIIQKEKDVYMQGTPIRLTPLEEYLCPDFYIGADRFVCSLITNVEKHEFLQSKRNYIKIFSKSINESSNIHIRNVVSSFGGYYCHNDKIEKIPKEVEK